MERSAEPTGKQLPAEHLVLRWVFKFNAGGRVVEWIFFLTRCLKTLLLGLLGIGGLILVSKFKLKV